MTAVLLVWFGLLTRPSGSMAQGRPGSAAGSYAGSILATSDNRVSVAEGDVVIIDQGTEQGVQVGDHFLALQEEYQGFSRRTGLESQIPPQGIGELTVIETYPRTAKALIIDSQFELSVGTIVIPTIGSRGRASSRIGDTELSTQTAARLERLSTCLETTRQALRATAAGKTAAQVLSAQHAVASAENLMQQATALLAEGKEAQAINRLDTAMADCLTAQDLATGSQPTTARQLPPGPDRYTVVRGDTLWGISAREDLYNNALLWPIIYKANREQIRNPDRIFPRQVLAIPRDYSQEEAAAAIQRSMQRGRWYLRDDTRRERP
jgi:LysM repeat protein